MLRIPARRCLLLVSGAALIAGCGADTYRLRLNETAQYFAYKQKLNEELGPVWSAMGVSLQPPRQFAVIPPPPPPAEGDETVENNEDPRQPHFLGVELPGLLGAWEATVMTDVGGSEEPRTAYLYVLGNHSRFLQKPDADGFVDDPQMFLTELENLLSGTIGVFLPEGETGTGAEKNQRYRETAPRAAPNTKFTPRKEFTAVTLSPQIDVGDLDLPFEMQLYEWAGQRIQVAILMIYPQAVSPRESLRDRLLLSLETLQIDDTPPSAASGGPDSGGGRQPAF